MLRGDFLRGATWDRPGQPVAHIETHAAHVFLVGDRAFKIKKAVKLPYLDFSTLPQRRAALAREFEVNRAFAPGIYVGVGEKLGEPVLEMRRFADRDLLGHVLERGHISDALARDLAAMVAAMHAAAPAAETSGLAIMAGLGAQLSAAFTASPDIFPAPATLEFHAFYEAALRKDAGLLNARGQAGLVRRCHGDLHSWNIVLVDGRPVAFDAIEFSEKIATIDVLYDLAFLLMDLWRAAERRAANLILNRYFDMRRGEEDLSGLALLPLFLSTRAGVRALVTADLIRSLPPSGSLRERGTALDYFRASTAYLKPAAPLLVAVGGLSGTGKSTLATSLAPELGAAPGAIHIRSDIERKRLAGVDDAVRLAPQHYTKEAAALVYEAMFGRAAKALAAGHSVVLDAVFSAPAERRMAEKLAERHKVRFHGVWLEAGGESLKARVAARQGDASDADPQVVERQLAYDLGTISWERIDAGGGLSQTLAALRRSLPPPPGGPAGSNR